MYAQGHPPMGNLSANNIICVVKYISYRSFLSNLCSDFKSVSFLIYHSINLGIVDLIQENSGFQQCDVFNALNLNDIFIHYKP